MRRVVFFSVIVVFFYACEVTDGDKILTNSRNVSLRMEVHVVDSLYPIYSIPLIKTHLYTYQQKSDGKIKYEEYSDTTTCRNGWAVKEMIYEFSEGDEAFLGATIKNPPAGSYQFETVTYDEISRFDAENDTIRFIKTFTIYEHKSN